MAVVEITLAELLKNQRWFVQENLKIPAELSEAIRNCLSPNVSSQSNPSVDQAMFQGVPIPMKAVVEHSTTSWYLMSDPSTWDEQLLHLMQSMIADEVVRRSASSASQ